MPDNILDTSADWTQVKETVLMLNTVVTQLGWTLRDGDGSVDTLTKSFQSMIDSASAILNAASSMEDGACKDEICKHGQDIYGQMQRVIVAFQFYDMLSQRLNHASGSLEKLAELIGNPVRLSNPDAWREFQQTIRARYTTEADKIMFDAVLNGASLEEAIAIFKAHEAESESPDMLFF